MRLTLHFNISSQERHTEDAEESLFRDCMNRLPTPSSRLTGRKVTIAKQSYPHRSVDGIIQS
jgi:hypothetical protein